MSVKKVTEICFKRQPQRTLVAKGKLLGRSPWGATGSWLCMKTELREEPYPQQTKYQIPPLGGLPKLGRPLLLFSYL